MPLARLYKQLFIATSFFWVAECVYLIPTIFLANDLLQSTLKITISSRQRALSERIANDVLQLRANPNQLKYIEGLKTDLTLFTTGYNALKIGGYTNDPKGNPIRLTKTKNIEVINSINNMDLTWQKYNQQLLMVISNPKMNYKQISVVIDYSSYASDIIARGMTKVTGLYQVETEKKAYLIQIIQYLCILFSLLNTILLSWHIIQAIKLYVIAD